MSEEETAEPGNTLRAYRFALDLLPSQETMLRQHAGAARWAFNFALGNKVAAHQAYNARITALTEQGLTPEAAKQAFKQEITDLRMQAAVWDHHRQCLFNAKVGRRAPAKTPKGPQELLDRLAAVRDTVIHEPKRYAQELAEELAAARERVTAIKTQLFESGAAVPGAFDNMVLWRQRRDLPKEEGGSPWWDEVSVYSFSTGVAHADAAWKNWMESFQGVRKGRRVGYPRFKAKGRSRDSFTLFHDVKNPGIRPDGRVRLMLPRIGSVRLAENNKRLARLIDKGHAVVKSVTISRGGTRWYASVLVELTAEAMRQREATSRGRQRAPKKRQTETVGVEWGVRTLVTLSNMTKFENSRPLKQASRRLRVAAQAVTRKPVKKGQPTSANRAKALRRLGRVHHEIAQRRAGELHQITATIAPAFRQIAMRDLNVQKMTKSAKGSLEKPGREVKVKARFNAAILDAAPGELRRQLTYKTAQYGAELGIAPIDTPSSQTCSKCGWRDPSIPLTQVVFQCGNIACGNKLDREVNSSRVIRDTVFPVASDSGETDEKNACGEAIRPSG